MMTWRGHWKTLFCPVEPDVLYTQFRGRMPGIDALLQGRGLAT